MTTSTSSHIDYAKGDGYATITLNRPAVLNAVSGEMIRTLPTLLADVAADDDVRALILTGNGRAFSAGIDLAEQADDLDGDLSLRTARDALTGLQTITRAMARLPKPIIAAINGLAVGAGAELAISADIRLAAEPAYFMFAEVKRALFQTNGVMHYLPRIVGYGRAMEMLLTGDRYHAPDLLRFGLVTHVLPPEQMLPFAVDMARRLAANAPVTLRLLKEGLQRTYDLDLEAMMQLEVDGMMACLLTEDYREGVRAFMEKRPPRYQGR